MSSLSKGTIKILKDKTATESYAIESGFVEMINNKATVLVEGVAE